MALSRAWLSAVALVAACGGSPAPEPDSPDLEEPQAPAVQAADELGEIDPSVLEAEADKKYALVPSPLETQAALAHAGIEAELAALVTERTFDVDDGDTDRIAVRTGVVLADLLLSVKSSSDAQLVSQLQQARAGLAALKAGSDLLAAIDGLTERVQAGAIDRDALVRELEEVANVAIPEMEFQGVAKVVPLIQAGSWLEGAHLVARAIQAKGDPTIGDGILKQPAVVAYFSAYTQRNAEGEVPNVVSDALDRALADLATVSSKSESLTDDDLATIVSATEMVLALL